MGRCGECRTRCMRGWGHRMKPPLRQGSSSHKLLRSDTWKDLGEAGKVCTRKHGFLFPLIQRQPLKTRAQWWVFARTSATGSHPTNQSPAAIRKLFAPCHHSISNSNFLICRHIDICFVAMHPYSSYRSIGCHVVGKPLEGLRSRSSVVIKRNRLYFVLSTRC